jgi:hypothetical protein
MIFLLGSCKGLTINIKIRGSRYFCERFFWVPARKISKKLREHQCLRLPRSVLLCSLHTQQGVFRIASHDLTPFRYACIFTTLHFVKTHTLRLSATKSLHFASAPLPRFSAIEYHESLSINY